MAGQEDYEHFRKQLYTDTNLILLCVQASLPTVATTSSIIEKWLPEIECFCTDVPIILVAIEDPDSPNGGPSGSLFIANPDPQPLEENKHFKDVERQALARRIGAVAYLRCELQTGQGVDAIFELVSALSPFVY